MAPQNNDGFALSTSPKLRSGKFSAEETEAVKNAVEEFCSLKQISVARLCSECDHKAELKGAWMEIAKRLPHRSVQSVYRHGLRQLHPFKRGTWSDEEVEILISSVAQHGKKWSLIQQKLNRSADSCRDKYREMDDTYVRGRWKENETEQLKRLIREHLRADPRADIKQLGKMVEAEQIKIPWSVISKKMGKRSRLSCFKKWQKMTGLFSPSDLLPKDVHKQIQQQQQSSRTNRADCLSTTVSHQNLGMDTDMDKSSGNYNEIETVVGPSNQCHRYESVTALRSDHQAPTAGAAAANVIATGLCEGSRIHNSIKIHSGAAIGDNEVITYEQLVESDADVQQDLDMYILSELVSLGVNRAADVAWDDLRCGENAQERWDDLLDEWQLTVTDDSLLALPISEIAQLILERKTSAQRAAETVEAVDLPPVPRSLHARDRSEVTAI